MSYVVGHTIRLYCDFYNLSGAAADPTGVTLTLQAAGGAPTVYTYAATEITRESTGVYYREITLAAPIGRWNYRWEGTGAVKAVEEGTYTVEASRLT